MDAIKEVPSRLARIPGDLAAMLSGIVEVEGGTIAEIVDPLIRPEVTRRFREVKPTLDKIRRAKAQHQRAGEK